MSGYIVIEQEIGTSSFYTVKYDFNFKNSVDDFQAYGVSADVLNEVLMNGVAQQKYSKPNGDEFMLTIIKGHW